jgi:hypothetical protein
MMIIAMVRDEETTTMAVVEEALAVIRRQERSGTDDAITIAVSRRDARWRVHKAHIP